MPKSRLSLRSDNIIVTLTASAFVGAVLFRCAKQWRTATVQSVEKPLSLSKNGVWGVAPRQVAGTPVPVFTPFPGERGQGDRDNKSEVYFKNRLFLQPEQWRTATVA